MRVLVTGASGHLGRLLRASLEASDSQPIEPRYLVSPRSDEDGPRTAAIDLTDLAALDSEVRKFRPEAIVHLAAITGGAADLDPVRTQLVNVDATSTIAVAAAESGGTRFVFASTSALYGDKYHAPVAEDAPLDPTTTYAKSKHEAERRLRDLTAAHPVLGCTALRIFNIYGPGFVDSLVARLRASSPGRPVSLRGPDNFVRDYVSASDVVASIRAALVAESGPGFVPINIATGIPTSNRQLAQALEQSGPVYYETVAGPPSYSCAQVGLANRLLGLDARPLTSELE